MAIRISHKANSEDFTYHASLAENNKFTLLKIGRHSYGSEFFIHWEGEDCHVEIARYCSIAQGVRFFAGQEHNTHWTTTYPFSHLPAEWPELRSITGHPASKGNIVVGNDVWIGFGALIRSGINIGNGAVIAMGAIVTRDVPPYAIVAGSPATLVRFRFSSDIIEQLNQLSWWNQSPEIIRKIAPKLCQPLNTECLDELICQITGSR